MTAVDSRTAEEVQRVMDSLLAAPDQPYFGRVDYFILEPGWDQTDELVLFPDEVLSPYAKLREPLEDRIKRLSKVMYLGVSDIGKHNVYSWTVPAARLWYTNEQGYPVIDKTSTNTSRLGQTSSVICGYVTSS